GGVDVHRVEPAAAAHLQVVDAAETGPVGVPLDRAGHAGTGDLVEVQVPGLACPIAAVVGIQVAVTARVGVVNEHGAVNVRQRAAQAGAVAANVNGLPAAAAVNG